MLGRVSAAGSVTAAQRPDGRDESAQHGNLGGVMCGMLKCAAIRAPCVSCPRQEGRSSASACSSPRPSCRPPGTRAREHYLPGVSIPAAPVRHQSEPAATRVPRNPAPPGRAHRGTARAPDPPEAPHASRLLPGSIEFSRRAEWGGCRTCSGRGRGQPLIGIRQRSRGAQSHPAAVAAFGQ